MTSSRLLRSHQPYRSLRSRLVTLLLLVAQATSLLIVPLHAVAHANIAQTPEATASVASVTKAVSPLSNLFGHEQGLGCDDWSAAFSLDSHPAHAHADFTAVLPQATRISGFLPFAPLPALLQPFLARAPPRI